MGLRVDDELNYDRGFAKKMAKKEGLDYLTSLMKAKDEYIVKLADLIIMEGVDLRATDIQLSIPKDKAIVRYRVSGEMIDYRQLENVALEALVCRLKLLGGLDMDNIRLPQDGKLHFDIEGIGYDVRLSTLPTAKGENVSLRLLYSEELNDRLEDLNIRDNVIEAYRPVVRSREGLVLMTGPTGSGKTTTLYTTIGELLREYGTSKNIMTIEDPIEYAVSNIVQSQVNTRLGYDFEDGLRSILRQNPDIVLVGEIRDKKTADTAVRASNTGHLVFSTLHASDAVSTVIVLKQLGVPTFHIANSLKIVLNQRLVSKLCSHCKRRTLLDEKERHYFDAMYGYVADGCEECDHSGYKGVVLAMEMLKIGKEFKDLLDKDLSAMEMKERLGESTYYSLRQDLELHIQEGNVSVADAIVQL